MPKPKPTEIVPSADLLELFAFQRRQMVASIFANQNPKKVTPRQVVDRVRLSLTRRAAHALADHEGDTYMGLLRTLDANQDAALSYAAYVIGGAR